MIILCIGVSEPEPWLSQRFIAVLIWLYRVYRQLREKRQGENEMESLMKEIYFGLRFDNLYSLFPPMSSAGLCRVCFFFFFFFFFSSTSLLFHNFFSISSTCLLWWCWDKILGRLQPLKWFIAIETWYNSALRPEIKHWRTSTYKSYIKGSAQPVVTPTHWTNAAFRSHGGPFHLSLKISCKDTRPSLFACCKNISHKML